MWCERYVSKTVWGGDSFPPRFGAEGFADGSARHGVNVCGSIMGRNAIC